jgi:hypothetical protein
MLEERDVEQFQQVEICTGGTRVASGFIHPGACITRLDRASGRLETWREKDNPATWQHTIGQQNFYLILSLNSIIILFLYQNS